MNVNTRSFSIPQLSRARGLAGPRGSMLAVLAAVLLGSEVGCDRRHPLPIDIDGFALGTTTHYRLAELPPGRSKQELAAALSRVLDALENEMSTWRPESEISRFGRFRGTTWFDVSSDFAKVVAESIRIARLSGGAFDPTVDPLVALWGFGAHASARKGPPDATEIDRARARVGYERLEARIDPPAIRKLDPELSIDLSAIAKGFAVDKIAEFLLDAGVRGFLVEIGGEVRTAGLRPDGLPWRIGIEKPIPTIERSVETRISLREGAAATSGDYRNVVALGEESFSHTIDPRTGRPARHRLASATVLASTCMEADALATVLMVLGEDEGYTFCENHGIAALLLVRGVGGLEARRTSKMPLPDNEPGRAP
jgi:thiamine biosynthesis lipoprotein